MAAQAAVGSEPGTQDYVAESDEAVGIVLGAAGSGSGVPGLSRSKLLQMLARMRVPVLLRMPGHTTTPVGVVAYNRAPSWLGWALMAGRWYHAGEVDVTPQLLSATGKHVGQTIPLTINGGAVTVTIAGEVFVPTPGPELFISWQTLGPVAAAKLAVNSYDINLKSGTTTGAYIGGLTRSLGSANYFVVTPAGPSAAAQIKFSYFHLLAILIAVLAALGVLNSVLMATRERLHDLGIFKALGMTPAQTISVVLCWVIIPTIIPTIIAAIIAVPVGLMIQAKLIRHLAYSSRNLILPDSFVRVLGTGELALLALAGLAIAAAAALGPAAWAGASRTTTALHAE
ncbi:MAG: FtsX-like permease family protein [Solirubrobacteraceae bacterium]